MNHEVTSTDCISIWEELSKSSGLEYKSGVSLTGEHKPDPVSTISAEQTGLSTRIPERRVRF